MPELDLLDLARRWGVLPFAELWKWGAEEGSPGLTSHRLASSWAWAHFLHDAEAERLARFIAGLERGTEPRDAWAAAFDGVDEQKLREAVERTVFKGDFHGQPFEVHATTQLSERPLENVEVHAMLSRVAGVTGQLERAKAEAELAVAVAPGHTRAVEAQVSVERDPARRLELARRHAAAQPDDARALVLFALQLPHGDERAAALERALALAPEDPTALIELASERLEAHRLDEASTLAAEALRLAPWSLRVMVRQATILGARGDCQQAAATLLRAIDFSRLAPRSPRRLELEEQLRTLRSCTADAVPTR
jgi:tetratricopeptide (TPR) repeat protein